MLLTCNPALVTIKLSYKLLGAVGSVSWFHGGLIYEEIVFYFISKYLLMALYMCMLFIFLHQWQKFKNVIIVLIIILMQRIVKNTNSIN